MKTMLCLATLPLLAACATTTAARPQEGPARIGQTVYVDGITVRPERVIEDSRCAANAICVWQGRVVLRATVSGGRWKRTMNLTLGEPAQVADGALTLVQVSPAKYNAPLKPGDYRFSFSFQGGF